MVFSFSLACLYHDDGVPALRLFATKRQVLRELRPRHRTVSEKTETVMDPDRAEFQFSSLADRDLDGPGGGLSF